MRTMNFTPEGIAADPQAYAAALDAAGRGEVIVQIKPASPATVTLTQQEASDPLKYRKALADVGGDYKRLLLMSREESAAVSASSTPAAAAPSTVVLTYEQSRDGRSLNRALAQVDHDYSRVKILPRGE